MRRMDSVLIMCLSFTEAPKGTRPEPREALPSARWIYSPLPTSLIGDQAPGPPTPGKERRAPVQGPVGLEAAAVLGP